MSRRETFCVFFLAGTGIFGLGAAQKKELFSPIQLYPLSEKSLTPKNEVMVAIDRSGSSLL